MSVTKLNHPFIIGGKQVYPQTSADQIIKADGSKLETVNGISVDNADNLNGHPASYYATTDAVPFKFGIDANGNYGYIKDGADTVTPFKIGEVKLLSVLSGGINSTNPYELSYTFTDNYSQVVIVVFSSDTDNNGDNFYKVYSVRNSAIASASYTNYWNVTENEWDYFKPTLPSGISYPQANSKYTNEKDLNKDMYWETGTSGSTSFSCIAYKKDIKANDTAWMYFNFYRRGIVIILGVK